MLMPGSSSSSSATRLPTITTTKNLADCTSAGAERQRPAGRIRGIVGALDGFGDIVEEKAGDDRRHRRHQQRQRERQTDAGDDRGDDAQPAGPGRQPGQHRVEPGQRQPIEQFLQAEPQRRERQQGQPERLEEHRPQFAGEQIAHGGAGGLDDHGALQVTTMDIGKPRRNRKNPRAAGLH